MQILKSTAGIWLVALTTVRAGSFLTLTASSSDALTLLERAQTTRITNLSPTDGSPPRDIKLGYPAPSSSSSSQTPVPTSSCINGASPGNAESNDAPQQNHCAPAMTSAARKPLQTSGILGEGLDGSSMEVATQIKR